jgi:hypothetical protein
MNQNESQITLVNPEFEREPSLVIVLSRDDIKQTVMRRKGSNEVLYNIESNESRTKTSVYHPSSGDPIAILELRGLFMRDKIMFRGEEKKNIKDWLSGYSPIQTL